MLSVAHRDIKPQNVLVDGRKLVITDFGSAKQLVKSRAFYMQMSLISPTSVRDAIEHLS